MIPITNTTASRSADPCLPENDSNALLRHMWLEWAAQPCANEQRDIAFARVERLLTNRRCVALNLSNLRLTLLPMQFPSRLKSLNLSNNQLTTLPETLPDSLQRLNAKHNQLTRLPARLPSLIHLDVSFNLLTNLADTLPFSLAKLDVSHNELTHLPPTLPMSLTHLYVSYNQLRVLPDILPSCLTILNISHNRLTHFPANLPDTLRQINASYNNLSYLPDNLRHSVIINTRHNRLLNTAVFHNHHGFSHPLNALPGSAHFPVGSPVVSRHLSAGQQVNADPLVKQCRNFLIRLKKWHDQINRKRWKTIYTEAHADDFGTFLDKLHGRKNSSSWALKQCVVNWLNYLAKNGHETLRQDTFLLAKEAATSCVDRASYYFTSMHILMVNHQLLSHNASIAKVVQVIRGTFRLQILDEIAARHVARRRKQSPGFAEEIEIYFAYQYKLRTVLALPVYTHLQYGLIAGVTSDDVNRAKEHVLAVEQNEFMRYWLTQSALWEAILTKWNAEKKAAADERYLEAIYPNSLNAQVEKVLAEKGIAVDDADAHRAVSQELAAQLLYKERYALTQELLAEKQALSLLEPFNSPAL